MTTNEKIESLKKYYNSFEKFYTDEGEIIVSMDFNTNTIFYLVITLEECGCCSSYKDCDTELDWFIEHMSDSDFISLLDELKNKSINKIIKKV